MTDAQTIAVLNRVIEICEEAHRASGGTTPYRYGPPLRIEYEDIAPTLAEPKFEIDLWRWMLVHQRVPLIDVIKVTQVN